MPNLADILLSNTRSGDQLMKFSTVNLYNYFTYFYVKLLMAQKIDSVKFLYVQFYENADCFLTYLTSLKLLYICFVVGCPVYGNIVSCFILLCPLLLNLIKMPINVYQTQIFGELYFTYGGSDFFTLFGRAAGESLSLKY